MEPHLSKNDIKLFYKYLDKGNVYFEYGSGGSTYQASIRKNIKTIYSVESDISWQKKLNKTIKHDNINYILTTHYISLCKLLDENKKVTNKELMLIAFKSLALI